MTTNTADKGLRALTHYYRLLIHTVAMLLMTTGWRGACSGRAHDFMFNEVSLSNHLLFRLLILMSAQEKTPDVNKIDAKLKPLDHT